MQVRRLLLLAPLALLGCQSGFEECGEFNWFLCAFDGAQETTGEPTTTQPTVSPAECGNSIREGDEVCDGPDSTMNAWEQTKTCAADCAKYADYCGDKTLNGPESCDDPGGNNTPSAWEQKPTCKDDCSGLAQYCGDDDVNGPEVCDSGVANSDMYTGKEHCNADCTKIVPFCGDGTCQAQESLMQCPADCMTMCGDGMIQAGEQCDDGGDTLNCDGDCTTPSCGDAYTNPAANEQCDDGNMFDTDACRNDCTSAACGDGVVQAGVEECDDANKVDDDECSDACILARHVFVTAGTFNADVIKGVLGADDLCKAAGAAVPGAPGNTWVAWLSDDKSSPITRVPALKTFSGWYLLPTGAPVAKGWDGLTGGMLQNAIQVTEAGLMVVSNPLAAWTNTKPDGTTGGAKDCTDWSNADVAVTSGSGDITKTAAAWTESLAIPCATPLRLYCFEVSP